MEENEQNIRIKGEEWLLMRNNDKTKAIIFWIDFKIKKDTFKIHQRFLFILFEFQVANN